MYILIFYVLLILYKQVSFILMENKYSRNMTETLLYLNKNSWHNAYLIQKH